VTRDLIFVIISLFFWGIGEGSFMYFQTLYLEQWGATAIQIGAVLSAWGFSMAIAQIPAGYLADKRGPRTLMWATWILGTGAAVLMAAANGLGIFIAGFLLYGLTASVSAPLNAYVVSVRGSLAPERALTIASAAFNFGMTLGPSLGGWLAEQYSLRAVYALAGSFFTISTLFILLTRKPPFEDHSIHPKATPLYSNRRFLFLVVLTFMTMFALFLPQPLTPNFLSDQHGINLQQIGLLGTLGSLGTVVLALALGGLKSSLGFLIGQPMVALFTLLIWKGDHFLAFSAAYFLFGGYRLTRVMLLGLARRMIHPEQMGLAYGMLETANAVAIILAPLLAGALYQRSPGQVYLTALLLIGAILLLNTIFLYRRRSALPAREPARILKQE